MALLEIAAAMALGGGDGIDCTFAGATWAEPVVAVTLEPVPSLKDRPGLYRVMMAVGGARIRANAQPIVATAEADVMIRARAAASTYYTIGLGEDGAAALHLTDGGEGRTLLGRCENHESWFPGWLATREAR